MMQEVKEVNDSEDSYFGQLGLHAKRRAAMKGVPLETMIAGCPEVKAIVDAAREGGFDLLIVGYAVPQRTSSFSNSPAREAGASVCSTRASCLTSGSAHRCWHALMAKGIVSECAVIRQLFAEGLYDVDSTRLCPIRRLAKK
jgi:hypothetical protein